MGEQLQGRELDRAVAKAIGGLGGNFTRNYSTDAATLPEMLAWLQARSDYSSTSLSTVREVERSWPWAWTATMHYQKPDSRLNITGHGQSLNEALCRLILAVAPTPGGEPKQEGA